ncbi:MAG TPA: hypothetical protein PK050_12560, partial [Hyphomonadaceae bacterium]|nr:hypothetical protein [Hyphomonadaceae bacterium]
MVSVPFSVLTLFDEPRLSQIAARAYTAQRHPAMPPIARKSERQGDKIHIAYMSADFRDHPVSYLMMDTLKGHDRSRFKVTGIEIAPPDRGPVGRQVREACDVFIEGTTYSDEQIAALIAEQQVDIVVDLMGHTRNARPGILALRPAPVQVNYLGYPGTMGAPYMDYLIADPVIAHIPEHFDEKLCLLPDTYLPTSVLADGDVAPTRAGAGLPEEEFVFSSFCNNWKITPDVFAIWMRLLKKVEGSVLWLPAKNDDVQENLRRSAGKAGVDPARIVFAPRVNKHADHIARQNLADVMLDTFPYGAHTTTADALWVGLPLVTRSGESFYSRVARSLLKAANLEQYATDTPEAYEALALELATNPASLKAAREAFGQARKSPLFDTERFVANLEAAYTQMFERTQGGLQPESFTVRT